MVGAGRLIACDVILSIPRYVYLQSLSDPAHESSQVSWRENVLQPIRPFDPGPGVLSPETSRFVACVDFTVALTAVPREGGPLMPGDSFASPIRLWSGAGSRCWGSGVPIHFQVHKSRRVHSKHESCDVLHPLRPQLLEITCVM